MRGLGILQSALAAALVCAGCTGDADLSPLEGGALDGGGSSGSPNTPAIGGGGINNPTGVAAVPTGTCGPTLIAGGTVGPATQPTTCRRPLVTSSLPASWIQSLGTKTTGERVTFQVPANSQSVTVIKQAVTATDSFVTQNVLIPNGVVPDLLTGPDAAVYWNDTVTPPADGSQSFLIANGLSPSTGLVSMPNTSAMLTRSAAGVPPGSWSFRVNDWAYECASAATCASGNLGNTYDVQVLSKPGPAKSTGVLDVAFYLVGTTNLTSATAIQNASVRRMVNTLNTYYQRAGICLGKVTFYDVPGWAQAKYGAGVDASKSGACDDLGQMFTLSQPGNALNLFLVQSLTAPDNGGGTQVVGVDGAIPGPSSFSGGVRSGAAVSAADLMAGTCGANIDVTGCGADFTAYIAAHEGGHWLGLYHTTEATGDSFDPISDSGTCACNTCAPLDQRNQCGAGRMMSVSECASTAATCGGGNNLMFWVIGGTGQLSAEQGQIMRANPLILDRSTP